MKNQEQKLSFEEQITLIFRTVYQQNIQLSSKACNKVEELMKTATQQIIQDAVKRSIRRDASQTFLQGSDLLAAIQKRGEKYKVKIGKYLLTAKDFEDYGQKKISDNLQDDGEKQEAQIQR